MTAGAHGVPREVTEGVIDGLIIPIMKQLIFIIAIKQILVICRDGIQMLSNFHCLDTNLPQGDEQEPNEEGLQFYDDLSMNALSREWNLW